MQEEEMRRGKHQEGSHQKSRRLQRAQQPLPSLWSGPAPLPSVISQPCVWRLEIEPRANRRR
jgi:hypothetical protein